MFDKDFVQFFTKIGMDPFGSVSIQSTLFVAPPVIYGIYLWNKFWTTHVCQRPVTSLMF